MERKFKVGDVVIVNSPNISNDKKSGTVVSVHVDIIKVRFKTPNGFKFHQSDVKYMSFQLDLDKQHYREMRFKKLLD